MHMATTRYGINRSVNTGLSPEGASLDDHQYSCWRPEAYAGSVLDIGVAGIVGDMFAFQAAGPRSGWR